jgi:hypothetical protein
MIDKNRLMNELQSQFGASKETAQDIASKAVEFEPIFQEKMDSEFTNELIISKMSQYSTENARISWNWYVEQLAFICEVSKGRFKL